MHINDILHIVRGMGFCGKKGSCGLEGTIGEGFGTGMLSGDRLWIGNGEGNDRGRQSWVNRNRGNKCIIGITRVSSRRSSLNGGNASGWSGRCERERSGGSGV